MKARIIIKTPKGQASGTEEKLRAFILPGKVNHQVMVNDDDDTIIWEAEGTVKQIMRINKNVAMFDVMIKGIMDNKLVKKACEPGQYDQLKEMLANNTRIEIIKEASAEEWVESNKTWWDKIKEGFKKKSV